MKIKAVMLGACFLIVSEIEIFFIFTSIRDVIFHLLML